MDREIFVFVDLQGTPIEAGRLGAGEARAVASEVASAVATWRDAARGFGASRRDIDRMASAFEHPDADAARRLRA